MNVLITGATGFVGSHVAKKIFLDGHKLFILFRTASDISRIAELKGNYSSYIIGEQPLSKIFEKNKIDIVIHCATAYERDNVIPQAHRCIESNVLFPVKLLELANRFNCKAFINTCSFYLKNNDLDICNMNVHMSHYILTKKQFREWGNYYSSFGDICFINMVLEHVYGLDDRKDKFIPYVIDLMEKNVDSIDLSTGLQIRDFISVDDVAEAFLVVVNAIDQGKIKKNEDFEVGTGEERSLRSFVELLKNIKNSSTELNWGKFNNSKKELERSVANIVALKNLGWMPQVVNDNQIIDYYR